MDGVWDWHCAFSLCISISRISFQCVYSLVTASASASASIVEAITATAAGGPACRFDDHSVHNRRLVYVNIMAASSLTRKTPTHNTKSE